MTAPNIPTAKLVRTVGRTTGREPVIGLGWRVWANPSDPPLAVHETKDAAIQAATAELRTSPAGGTLLVLREDGSVNLELAIEGQGVSGPAATPARAAARPELTSLGEVFGSIRAEKKQVDQHLEVWLLALSSLIPGPVLAAWFRPDILQERSWFGIFLATLAWSLGVAAFLVALDAMNRSNQTYGGVQIAVVAMVCLGGSALVALSIGIGAYSVEPPFVQYPAPFKPLAFVYAAVMTFGPGGAILGAASGAAAAHWAIKPLRALQAQW
jgi:hypothetical protein